MHGKGTLIYPNGERYEGSWVYGKRHGFGAYHYLDGGRYEGEWVDDRIQGKGKSVYANGNVSGGRRLGARVRRARAHVAHGQGRSSRAPSPPPPLARRPSAPAASGADETTRPLLPYRTFPHNNADL